MIFLSQQFSQPLLKWKQRNLFREENKEITKQEYEMYWNLLLVYVKKLLRLVIEIPKVDKVLWT